MEQQYVISGMHCNACVRKVQDALASVAGVGSVHVTLDPPVATLHMTNGTSINALQSAVARAGTYSLEDKNLSAQSGTIAESAATGTTYKPLILVVAYILLAVILSQIAAGRFIWHDAMRVFMGGFFIAFSFFKMLDLRGFADAYRTYDIVAGRWPVFGYIYPFIELTLGIAYLIHFHPVATNLTTLIVMTISSVGVIRAVADKRKIRCACLGTGFKLPMSTVTIIEDVTMALMAAVMLLMLWL